MRSRADVARAVAMASDGVNGGLMVSERQQGGVGHGGSRGEVQAAGCLPGPAKAVVTDSARDLISSSSIVGKVIRLPSIEV